MTIAEVDLRSRGVEGSAEDVVPRIIFLHRRAVARKIRTTELAGSLLRDADATGVP